MARGGVIFNPDVQSDIDMKNTYKLINYPASSGTLLSIDKTIYVDAVNGTAGGQRGTTAAFQTLAQAVAVVQAGDVIEVRSNLIYTGAVTVSVSGVTLDFRNHTISPSVQTDSQKIIISSDGVTVKNLEINGLYTNGNGNGSAISVTGKRFTLYNVYIHDVSSDGIDINGDFSGLVLDCIKIDNTKSSGIYINSQNDTVTAADIGRITITNTGQKGIAVARGGAESNQVYGINIHDIYYDTGFGVGQEAMYIHGITDFSISNVRGYNNEFNVSLDTCVNGTLENIITRGGLGANQYCGLELAGCQKITVSNSVFDGLSKSGGTSTAAISAGIIGSNLSQAVKAGDYTFNNVVSKNWPVGLAITLASNINVSGGIYSGVSAGIAFGTCDTVLVTNSYIAATGSSSSDMPISIDSGAGNPPGTGITNKDYRFIGNMLFANTGCTREIGVSSQDANHQISGITIKDNIKLDSEAITPYVTTIGAGGAISDVVVTGNQPASIWNNDTYTGFIYNGGDPTGDTGNLNPKWLTLGSYTEGGGISYSLTDHKLYLQSVKPGVDWEDFQLDAKNITLTTHSGAAKVGSNTIETQNNKGQVSGYASLDGSGKVPAAQLPTLSSGTIAVTSDNLKGDGAGNAVAVTATGTGDTVLATSPTLVTPTIGVATATSVNKWTLTAPSTAATLTAGADNLTYTMPEISTKVGFRHIPQNSQSASYTTVLNDSGKHIYHPAADANNRTITIDSNANVAYPIGTAIMFVNLSANNLSIAITADTMYLAGVGTTGTRTLAQYGKATAVKTNTTEWVIAGIGLS